MLLRYDFKLEKEASAVEAAVDKVLEDGWRTADIAGAKIEELKVKGKIVGTKKMGQLVISALKAAV